MYKPRKDKVPEIPRKPLLIGQGLFSKKKMGGGGGYRLFSKSKMEGADKSEPFKATLFLLLLFSLWATNPF